MELIELTETWALRITICTNAETVCDGRDVGPWEKEVTREVASAGQEVVTAWTPGCEAADEESFFADWHGGEHYRPTYQAKHVAAELYHREPEAQGEDDLVYSGWAWIAKKDAPRVLQDGVESLVNAVSDAMGNALDAAEERIAADNRRFAAEEARAK